MSTFFHQFFKNTNNWALPALVVMMIVVGLIEFALKLYENKWNKNERILDITCFVVPRVVLKPLVTYVSLWMLPKMFPNGTDMFSWIPFWWAFFIVSVFDDLTVYWMHRLQHQLPVLWRFHRTHHSASYMGMAMAGRHNFIFNIFFSFQQILLFAAFAYLGLGYAVLFATALKTVVTVSAHSSIAWDKPFYKYKILHPFAWVLERLISTPATHHAHHADTNDDGVGYYKGNFANVFFIWDIIFKTGLITRKYPAKYGLKYYLHEEWYAQLFWPFIKSKKEGSELAKNGPIVGDENHLSTHEKAEKMV